jgi:hypothetical protein
MDEIPVTTAGGPSGTSTDTPPDPSGADAAGPGEDPRPEATTGGSTGDLTTGERPGGSTGEPETTGEVGAGPDEIVCGEVVCDRPTEFCLACSHDKVFDAHCLPRTAETVFEEWSAAFEHGCDFPHLLIGCDSPDDCGPDRECMFSSGEAGYAFCREPDEFSYGLACADDDDCTTENPSCEPYDDFGYFEPFEEILGWTPMGCAP